MVIATSAIQDAENGRNPSPPSSGNSFDLHCQIIDGDRRRTTPHLGTTGTRPHAGRRHRWRIDRMIISRVPDPVSHLTEPAWFATPNDPGSVTRPVRSN